MVEVRILGRGGQGVVLASRLIALALFKEGWWVQSFPTFGAERRGAPIAAFVRADKERILLRCGVVSPDVVMVLDDTLFSDIDVFSGLKKGGTVIVNTKGEVPVSLGRLFTVDAVKIAVDLGLGSISYPLVNTAMVGAFARVTGLVGIEGVEEAIRELVSVNLEKNLTAVRRAYDEVKECG